MHKLKYLPKLSTEEKNVITTERSRDPPNKRVYIFDPPPPGQLPWRNSPSLKRGLDGKIKRPRTKDNWKKNKIMKFADITRMI